MNAKDFREYEKMSKRWFVGTINDEEKPVYLIHALNAEEAFDKLAGRFGRDNHYGVCFHINRKESDYVYEDCSLSIGGDEDELEKEWANNILPEVKKEIFINSLTGYIETIITNKRFDVSIEVDERINNSNVVNFFLDDNFKTVF